MLYTGRVIKPFNAETLALHKAKIEHCERELVNAKAARDNFIRGMLEKGESPTETATAAGISRIRVYQIRDHKR